MGTYFCENRPKSSKFSLACDFTAISSEWFLCTTYAYGLKHVIKYHTAIKWADGRATGTYFCENRPKMFKISSRKGLWPFQSLWTALQIQV